ncbi:MAG TPA: T9SS type A sorting domain-containing protein, partial [Niastella sp.]
VPAVSQKLYYRIRGTEPTGRTYLSPVVTISNEVATHALIDYTTIQGQLLLTSLQVPEKGIYTLSVISMNGAVLQQRALGLNAGVHVLTLPLHAIAHGTYVVRLSNNRQLSSKKFVW